MPGIQIAIDKSVTKTAQRLAAVTSLLSGWVWETDPEHRFTYMSESVEEFAGRSAAWHYGKTRDEIGNLCEPTQYLQFVRRLEAREPFSAIDFIRHYAGKTIHMRTTGQPFYEAGQFRGYRGIAYRVDNNARQNYQIDHAEQEAERTLTLLRSVVSDYPFAIVVFNADLKMLFANDKYYRAIGVAKIDLPVGSSFYQLLDKLIDTGELRGDTSVDIIEQHVHLARAGKPFIFERSCPNGRVLQVHGFPLPCGGFARTFIDITDRAEDKWTIAALRDELATVKGTF